MTYSQKIKEIRQNRRMNMRDFADLVDLNFSTISLLEKGFRGKNKIPIVPLIDTLKQICDRTHYPFRQFLEEAGYIEAVTELKADEKELLDNYRLLGDNERDSVLILTKSLIPQTAETTTVKKSVK